MLGEAQSRTRTISVVDMLSFRPETSKIAELCDSCQERTGYVAERMEVEIIDAAVATVKECL
jgi:hypothetical protein